MDWIKRLCIRTPFRHRYAKNFLEKYNDIALLADLMGHESIETTRIYLRRTASEQRALVDKDRHMVKETAAFFRRRLLIG